MRAAELTDLAGRAHLGASVLYGLLDRMGVPGNYDRWMLTDPVCVDFELCRTEEADPSLCRALLTAVLREASLREATVQARVDRGQVQALLARMAVQGDSPLADSPPWYSLEELWRTGCAQIPAEPGVYYVLLPEGVPRFRRDVRGGYEPETLDERWEKSGGRCLYIGKASGKNGLRGRIRQYLRCGFAGGRNHRGGRAIWQVEQQDALRLSWQTCPRADALEKRLLARYHEIFNCYPAANRRG